MEKISLYYYKDDRIEISISIYFNNAGQLVLDGYDIGAKVEDFWGDSDYEYSYTIEPGEVKKIYTILKINPTDRLALLMEIRNRFGGNKAYSDFGRFMDENGIDYEAFTWS